MLFLSQDSLRKTRSPLMDNYKIKVKDEAESKEAQELFFELGFRWKWSNKREILRESIPYLFTEGEDIFYGVSLTEFDECVGHELAIEELRVLAKAKHSQDPALISGAEALADITKVQHAYDCSDDWYTTQYSTLTIPEVLNGKTNCGHEIKFRVKPTTININTELPKPEREFHQNTEVYAVTYEFKTREERNAFADKLRGTNS